ncbi:hypothetical protein ILUMI_03352 [Ignelater luminosus]|uniref:Uncharacterized protein n=1 Tax=Ignelater luminosus TaxID=2038154 RepID=A0A8K0GFK9_IGNLU|nr:hypothetical protein ILUMI_03352 [Ignelater luminosus]
MEVPKRRRKKTKHQDIPKVPIQTYKWEDVRRAKKRGDYPWTHLTKPPFDEEVDPEEFTMDAYRRSVSPSSLGKSDTQDISEIEEVEMKEEPIESQDEEPQDNKENLDESNKETTQKPSSSKTVKSLPPIKTITESRSKSEEPKKKRKLSLETYTAKINLPKIDLKDKLKDAKSKIKVPKLPKIIKSDTSETQTKKPKLTKPSETTPTGSWMPPPPDKPPVYIHIPLKPPPGETDEYSKYEFDSPGPSSHSGSLTQLQRIGSGRKMSLLGLLTEIKKVAEQHQKLASESRKSPELGDGTEEERKPKIELVESFKTIKPELRRLHLAKGPLQRKESDRLVIEEITDEDRKSAKSDTEASPKPKSAEPIVDEPEDSSADDNVSQYLDKDDKCEIVSEKSEENVSQAGPSKKEEPEEEVDSEKLRKLEATLSKWKKQAPGGPAVSPFKLPGSSGASPFKSPAMSAFKTPAAPTPEPAEETERPRAKSEEPKRKRKSSIESSYSRKSLSKLAFMKRLKEAKDKIKLPKFPSFSRGDKKEPKQSKSKEKKKEEVPDTKVKSKLDAKKSDEPLYIHIPLKLPPGQKDEFSHLAEEIEEKINKGEEVKKETEEPESSVPTSPDVPPSGVQLIILTPPSDDEILDGSIPPTPSETDQKFFDRIDELKNLAKKAVDQVCPEPKKLETVTEDEGSDEQSEPESSQEQLEEKGKEPEDVSQKQSILVDEEDGLKLSDAAIAMINEELAKELKEQEKEKEQEQEKELKSSLKKKVSFKRKSRAEDGERIYEDVQLSKTADDSQTKKLTPLESTQSMSVDEEKSYLDKKVIKDTSLEEDYNKWSKLNDHEYEPVNPPPEDISRGPLIVGTAAAHHQVQQPEETNKTGSLERRFVRIPPDDELVARDENMDENVESAQEVQKQIEEHFFTAAPETATPKTGGEFKVSPAESPQLGKEIKKKITTTTTTTTSSSATPPGKDESIGKTINTTLRNQADKIKTKLQGIKKPNITLPQRPKFPTAKLKKPNFKKPTFKMPKMPKMPEKPTISLPSFMTRKESSKDSWRSRQLSTESNAGDSTKKIFDFKTYPRIFDKYKKSKEASPSREDRNPTPPPPEFATVPRVNRKKGPVGSRWVNKFKDIEYADEDAGKSKEFENEDAQDIRIPLHPDNEVPMDVPSHTRYNEDIDIEDDFDRENHHVHRESPFNRDYLKRWNHGEFHGEPIHQLHYEHELDRRDYRITDLDNDMEETQSPLGGSFDIPQHTKDEHSSGSLSEHRRGVLEEIDSDEFFLREKGISQENIEVGKYLSSEIREAFRNPVNALSQLQSEDREYDLDVSDQSEPLQDAPRRKPLRKPKRKKTPHVSNEKVNYDRESVNTEPEEYPKPFEDYRMFPPPARPKRRSKKGKKKIPTVDDVIPYQETIPIEEQFQTDQTIPSDILQDNILREDEILYRNAIQQMYENEHMRGIEQPEIKVSDPYYRYENFQQDLDKFLGRNEAPTAPTRKHRSLKSLTASERSSIADDIIPKEIPQQNVEVFRAQQEYIIPTPEPPPPRPKRTRSRTHSQSGGEDDRTSRGADSLVSDTQPEVVEEACVQDVRDTMGYAVVDKSKAFREPPLPPSRLPPSTPPRTRRSKKGPRKPDKFSTVPRSTSDSPPVRPLRNYSTLGGSSRTSRTSRSKSPTSLHGEEKENIDIGQYIEIENGEPVRHLQSGEVIQKMKDRPLPAPPRPPRRPRGSTREVFRDISHERNLPPEEDIEKAQMEETETSTQTEPVPENLVGEEQDSQMQAEVLADIEKQILPCEHEETVTHAALVVQPLNNAQILPYSQLSRPQEKPPIERTIPVTRESTVPEQPRTYDDEETSEIPEEFTKLKNPPPKPSAAPPDKKVQKPEQEVGILKAQKMQVMDLDVDKLRVNELQASKIIVSELDGMSLQVSEINSKSGNLVVSGIELPPHIIQEMLNKLQSGAQEHADQSSESQTLKGESTSEQMKEETQEQVVDPEQKKTSIEDLPVDDIMEEAPPVPPRYDSKTDLLDENLEEHKELAPEPEEVIESIECDIKPVETIDTKVEESEEPEIIEEKQPETPPIRPPRKSSQAEKIIQSTEESPARELPVITDVQSESQESPPPVVEEGRRSPPSELPVLPVEPPESSSENVSKSEEEPPPRPPQPTTEQQSEYAASQPPASFYALRSPPFEDFVEEDIPLPPRRKHHRKAPPVSRSSSEDVPQTHRRHHRSPEPSIPQLTGQLVSACATEMDRSIKRLISHITNNVLQNPDRKQDLHVMILILLILIAGLILLSGDDKVVIHHHHWEFFNPPSDL